MDQISDSLSLFTNVTTAGKKRTANNTIEWLCANEKCGFSTAPEEWRRELAPGIYVWTDNSTATKINILHGIFEECNIPASEPVFEFRSDQDGEDEG